MCLNQHLKIPLQPKLNYSNFSFIYCIIDEKLECLYFSWYALFQCWSSFYVYCSLSSMVLSTRFYSNASYFSILITISFSLTIDRLFERRMILKDKCHTAQSMTKLVPRHIARALANNPKLRQK